MPEKVNARFRWFQCVVLAAFIAAIAANAPGWASGDNKERGQISPAAARLGLRLFKDVRFSTAKGDLPASCSHCHLFDEDPQGMRAHTDFLSRSWVSYRLGDPRRDELRNSPTLFDVATMPRLHFDGEFGSLEDLVKGTLAGRPMGWLPGEEKEAFEQICRVVLGDKGEIRNPGSSYRGQFKQVYGVNLESVSRDDLVNLVARAISDYMRTLRTDRSSPYDQFVQLNGLESEPDKGEAPKTFGRRFLARISALESEKRLRFPAGFDSNALAGMKSFFRTEGEASGNCVTCHAPPLFTDLSFHNMGISQLEYDKVHGDGSFAALAIPGKGDAIRPSAQFRETPSRRKPGEVDLGHWNFVDLKSSPLRRPDESEDLLLARMAATFKTPTLRHLGFTPPYMHNGAFTTLEEALSELIRLSNMAREGRVRQGDEELSGIRITERDIAPLVAFLNTLNQDLRRTRRTAD
jgi:cytochrome c peroxidase